MSHHAHVLLALTQQPDARTRDLADTVGITERSAQRILAELQREGYVTSERDGRRTRYRVRRDAQLRHPQLDNVRVGGFLDALRTQIAR